MKITDIIRDILDLIDNEKQSIDPAREQEQQIAQQDDLSRFKQLAGLQDKNPDSEYANEPNARYADLDSVTVNAGGGLNGPKHPHDIRVKDPSAYPEYKNTEFTNTVNDKHSAHQDMLNRMK